MDLQNEIVSLRAQVEHTDIQVKLDDLCYMPTAPDIPICLISSPLQYFQNNRTRVKHPNATEHLEHCAG